MSVFNRFRTNSTLANEGKWVAFEANSDGTVPRFKLARMHRQNKNYINAIRRNSKNKANSHEAVDILSDEIHETNLRTFAETILIDWENVQPNDDGEVIEYSVDNVIKIFGHPDNSDFYDELAAIANDLNTYKKTEAEVKN